MRFVMMCTACGSRMAAPLATNELDLAKLGMMERRCAPCGKVTRWGLAEDYRRVDRRVGDRRLGGSWDRPERRSGMDRRRGRDRRRSAA